MGDSSTGGFGSRFCRVNNNRFINNLRDGIDSTGGLHGWQITNNYFRCAAGAIDAKQSPNSAGKLNKLEENYTGLIISNNVIHGCEIILTANVDLADYGSTSPDHFLVHGITASGNTFIPRARENACGYYFKGVSGFSSVGDNFTAYRLKKADYFDPAADGIFPSNSVEGTYYEATSTATIDGLAIAIGDFVVPRADGAQIAVSADWAIMASAWLSRPMFRFDSGETNH